MKTFFWTSIVWVLALGAFWGLGFVQHEVQLAWFYVIPTPVAETIHQNGRSQGFEDGKSVQEAQNLVKEESSTTGTIEEQQSLTGDQTLVVDEKSGVITGEKASESEFIVEVLNNQQNQIPSTTGVNLKQSVSQTEVQALEARVEALEYHLGMLMKSLHQPKVQPGVSGVKYPVWDYSFESQVQY